METLTLFFYLKTDALPLSRIPSERRLKPWRRLWRRSKHFCLILHCINQDDQA